MSESGHSSRSNTCDRRETCDSNNLQGALTGALPMVDDSPYIDRSRACVKGAIGRATISTMDKEERR